MAEKIFVLLLVTLCRAHFVCAITTQMTSFPGSLEFTVHGRTNNYHLVCITGEEEKVKIPFAVRILLETKEGLRLDCNTINCVRCVRLLTNSYTGDGFLLWCLHGPNEGDVGCNMLYYVVERNGKIEIYSMKDLLGTCDFGQVNDVVGSLWGAYYIGENTNRNDFAIAIKVGYGLGTNQIFTVGMREFSGVITRMKKEYPYPLINENVPDYEREIKKTPYAVGSGTPSKTRLN